MRVLHFSTYDNEGGAARATARLHSGLLELGIDSLIVVQAKKNDDLTVINYPSHKFNIISNEARRLINNIPASLIYPNRKKTPMSINWVPNSFDKLIEKIKPDLIHLHWIGAGFLPIREISKFTVPIIWTLHDSWPFTGGCHVLGECNNFVEKCGCCPQLGSTSQMDLSRYVWHHKQKHLSIKDLTIVCPSKWLAEKAKQSSLFRCNKICVIPNGLKSSVYKPLNKEYCRDILNLPKDKKIILFGAMSATSDENKGFGLLQAALRIISKKHYNDKCHAVVFGSSAPVPHPDFGVSSTFIGRLYDDVSLQILYSAANVVVVPSLQEAFGQIASEAMSCGTPVVAFGTSGLVDIVEHQVTGYLAEPYNSNDLAAGIDWVLNAPNYEDIHENARGKVLKEFDGVIVAKKYFDLYEEVLKEKDVTFA